MVGKKVLFLITGGIATYKAVSLVSYYSKNNETKVMMTKNATEFVTSLTFETISKKKVLVDMFKDNEFEHVSHVYYGQEYDFIVVAPATANILGKVANGIADDLVSSTIMASNKPIIFIPAMNTCMYNNPIVQSNIKKLKEFGYYFIEPDNGILACGYDGVGKFPEINRIIKEIDLIIKE